MDNLRKAVRESIEAMKAEHAGYYQLAPVRIDGRVQQIRQAFYMQMVGVSLATAALTIVLSFLFGR